MNEEVTISAREYLQLLEDSKVLAALLKGGVDNWEGYSIAMEAMDDEAEARLKETPW